MLIKPYFFIHNEQKVSSFLVLLVAFGRYIYRIPSACLGLEFRRPVQQHTVKLLY